MSKRVNPQTSNDAYKAVAPAMLNSHHAKIIAALKIVKAGMIYEQIAAHTRMDKHQVGRRLSELEKMRLVYKTGAKKNTSTGRAAFVYKLVENGEVSVKPEKMLPGKSVGDYAKAIQLKLI